MLKFLFSLIGVELTNEKHVNKRVRGSRGRYARKIIIREYGEIIDYIYTEPITGFIASGSERK